MKKIIAIALFAAACGSKAKPATTPVAKEEHKAPPAQMVAFHDVLSPLYHDETPERMEKVCGAWAKLDEAGKALAAAPTPEGGNTEKWAASGTALTAGIQDVRAKCDAKDATGFTPSFEALHTAFHGMMEASGIKPEGKGDHNGEGHGAHHGEAAPAPAPATN